MALVSTLSRFLSFPRTIVNVLLPKNRSSVLATWHMPTTANCSASVQWAFTAASLALAISAALLSSLCSCQLGSQRPQDNSHSCNFCPLFICLFVQHQWEHYKHLAAKEGSKKRISEGAKRQSFAAPFSLCFPWRCISLLLWQAQRAVSH